MKLELEYKMISFSREEAVLFGVNEAIILELLREWRSFNEVFGIYNLNGFYLVKTSITGLVKFLPYLSEKQIRKALFKLKDVEVLHTTLDESHSSIDEFGSVIMDEIIEDMVCKLIIEQPQFKKKQ